MATSQPFQWGIGGQQITSPEAAARQRAIAEALISQSATPAPNWSSGLADIAAALSGTVLNGRVDEAEAAGRERAGGLFANLATNTDPNNIIAALTSPDAAWATPGQSQIASALLNQGLQRSDPAYQLDMDYKRAQIGALDAKSNAAATPQLFDGTSMDGQAWNILSSTPPDSQEYATAYSIIAQPKPQMVQTENGMALVNVAPQLPAWVVPPTGGSSSAAGQPMTNPANAPMQAPMGATGGSPQAPVAAPQAPGNVSEPQLIPNTRKPSTEAQQRNGMLGEVLTSDLPTINANFDALADPKGQFLSKVPAGLGNAWQSEEYQQAANAVSSSVANILYSVSGASANPGETENQIRNLTPQFGDKPGTIADKKRRLNTFVQAVASASGDPDLIARARQQSMSGMGQGETPPLGQPDAEGWITAPNGVRLRPVQGQ